MDSERDMELAGIFFFRLTIRFQQCWAQQKNNWNYEKTFDRVAKHNGFIRLLYQTGSDEKDIKNIRNR